MLLGQALDAGHIPGIAQGVRQDDGARARSDGLGDPFGQGVVTADVHVDEHRNQAVLHDGRDRGGKGSRGGDDFVAGAKLARAELGRSQSRDRDQIGRGAGVHHQDVAQAEVFGQAAFEILGKTPGGQPEIQHRIRGVAQFGRPEHPTRVAHHRLPRNKRRVILTAPLVFLDQVEDARSKLLRVAHAPYHDPRPGTLSSTWKSILFGARTGLKHCIGDAYSRLLR